MKKRMFLLLMYPIFIFFILVSSNNLDVFAMSVNEVKSRDVCNTLMYEVAYANVDGTLSSRSCFASYEEAKKDMDSVSGGDQDNLVILQRVNNVTSIIDAKYAMIDYDQKVSETTYLYKTLEESTSLTYVKGGSSDDAPFLEYNPSKNAIKIRLSGVTAWMYKYDTSGDNQYDIIPLSWVASTATYVVSDTSITHILPGNLFGSNSKNYITLGPKPVQLEVGTYYSYDGNYFYKDLKSMIEDYRKGTFETAINSKDPYYNYYMYLSHRSKTNYTKDDINHYIESILGYHTKVINGNLTSSSSMLYGEGNSFYQAQELYGTNSILMFGVARNESGNGRSNLSINKNNLFGHSAVDSDPYAAGDSYIDVAHGIYAHAYKWLSYGYLQPGDYAKRFQGSHLGNKASGINVKYASDPYWGEKAAANYYQFDKASGMQDYGYYKTAVLNVNQKVYPKKTASTKGMNVSSEYYLLQLENTPILIVDEVKGDDGEVWYEIMSDPMLDEKLEYTGSSKSDPRVTYNWAGNHVYVPAKYFTVINNVEVKDPSDISYDNVVDPDDKTEEVKPNVTPTPSPSVSPTPTPTATPKPTPTPTATPTNVPTTNNPASTLQNREGNLYYFEEMSYQNNKLSVKGFMALTGMDNKKADAILHTLIFKNVDKGTEYVYSLNRFNDNVPFEMTNSDEKVKYDYSGGWFQGSLDLSGLPQGDYQVYIEVSNGIYKSRTNFNNLFFKDMVRKMTLSNKKGFMFSQNYLEPSVPMEVQVRDAGLLSTSIPPTIDLMYNTFEELNFNGNFLHIKGASHNVGVSYASSTSVSRSIVLENTTTYERFTYNVGSITNGPYGISLRVSDNKDKTRAWYDTSFDLSKLSSGVYAIYIKTSGDGGEDYGELADLLYTNMNQTTTINGKKVSLRRVDSKRFRIELVIE